MENKRNQCRECGGNGKPSKGIMNFHNVQTQDLSKEFETKVLDCIKCESCGHSWVPEKSKSLGKTSDEIEKSRSIRKQAIVWWNTINGTFKQRDLGLKYYPNRDGLTGREIEEIWKKENPIAALPDELINTDFDGIEEEHNILNKPNQKQFKTFDEDLFKAYINKFSDEDKLKAFNILNEEFAYFSHEQMELVQKQYDEQVKFLQNRILKLSK